MSAASLLPQKHIKSFALDCIVDSSKVTEALKELLSVANHFLNHISYRIFSSTGRPRQSPLLALPCLNLYRSASVEDKSDENTTDKDTTDRGTIDKDATDKDAHDKDTTVKDTTQTKSAKASTVIAPLLGPASLKKIIFPLASTALARFDQLRPSCPRYILLNEAITEAISATQRRNDDKIQELGRIDTVEVV